MNNKSDRLWNTHYIALVAVNFCSSFSFYMIVTLLSSYLTGLGISIAVAGVIIGLFSITSLVIRPFTGIMTDMWNKKWLVTVSAIVITVATFGYFMTKDLKTIVVLRILHGVGFGVNGTAVISLACQYIPESRTGEGIGFFGLSQVLSGAIGPGIGAMAMERFGMEGTFMAAGLMSLTSVVLMITLPVSQERSAVPRKLTISSLVLPEAAVLSSVGSIYSFINGIISAYLVGFSQERGILHCSLYFAVYSVVLFIVRPLSGKIMDRYGLSWVVYPNMVISAVSMVVLSLSGSLWMLLLSGALRAVGQGAVHPSLQAACVQKVGKEKAGVANSTFYLGGDVGQGLGPMLGGILIGSLGYSGLFELGAALLLLGLAVYHLVENRKAK